MKRLLLALLVSAVPAAASAQPGDHSEHSQPAGDPHAGHAMPSGDEPAEDDPHAGHAMPSGDEGTEDDPHAGHAMHSGDESAEADSHVGHAMHSSDETAADDPHAGHTPSSPAPDMHAGHVPAAAAAAVPPLAPPPPEALEGPEHAADSFWGSQMMARARQDLLGEHGDLPAYKVLFDQVEVRLSEGSDEYFINGEGWYGGDIDKLWVKTEIEGEFEGELEKAEFQALWSHAISPWFDLQTGVRYDVLPGSDRARLVAGVQGLAPYWIEVDAAAFLSDRGDLTARLEAEHDARITQKLVLQPRVEVNLSLQDIPQEQIGSGLVAAEAGVRLRYEISPLFAPYVGVEHERAFGTTRSYRRMAGDSASDTRFVFGIRTWF